MTLLEIFPSLRGAMTPRMDPALWPISTRHDHSGRVCIGDVSLEEIADQYGTPTYVVDEADVRHRCRTYREIFPDSEIVYARQGTDDSSDGYLGLRRGTRGGCLFRR